MVERMVRGLDDKRRSNIPPRQGWRLCVTPYFADLGVGDMRGDDIGIPHNRTPEVVRGCARQAGVGCVGGRALV